MVLRRDAFLLLAAAIGFSAAWAADTPDLAKAKSAIEKRSKEIGGLLDDVRVTCSFKDPSFVKAMEFFKEKFKLDVVVDPCVETPERKVLVEVLENIPLGSALQMVCGADLQSMVRGEAVFITTAKAAGKLSGREYAIPDKPTEAQKPVILLLHQCRRAANFDGKPVAEALASLGADAKVAIRIEPADAVEGMTSTVVVKDAALRSLLDLICGTRLAWMVADNSVLVGSREKIEAEAAKVAEQAKKAADEAKKAADKAKKASEEAKKTPGDAKKAGEQTKKDAAKTPAKEGKGATTKPPVKAPQEGAKKAAVKGGGKAGEAKPDAGKKPAKEPQP